MNILQIPNGNFFANRGGYKPLYVILHGTAGGTSAQGIANYFLSTVETGSPVSSHYVIGTDGTVVQCVQETDGAWANGAITTGADSWWSSSVNPNNLTISIEHCKVSSDNSDTLTSAQQAASFELIKDICGRWNIPMRAADASGGITGHYSIDPVNRSNCPGPYPWDELWNYVSSQEENNMLTLNDSIVANYFVDGGNGTWKCIKNGVILHDAILNFYASNGGPAVFGLPLENEIYLSQYPGTAIVPCERVIIGYDPQRKIDHPPVPATQQCYLLHIDTQPGSALITKTTTQPSTANITQAISTLSTIQTATKAIDTAVSIVLSDLKPAN